MSWVTLAAIFFIIWWVMLFAMLPFGLKTQSDSGHVAPGTVASAPAGRHMGKVVLRNTLAALVVFGAFYLIVEVGGFGLDDLPKIVPDFE